ncbi:DNA cytosine methyltransferase [Blautia schinkii]|uniref:DNA cytosine methyltransferase n=1 Tax=Blautia schinkii TaxID=180164 RepID=UPI001570AAAD|nr:DNA cytosine methyltransferase [Blautia schinkii]NSK33439.1 DNA cytosine methyltransferase [Blautia schinkii]NSK48965.1 DNA cytosine methyltransferase [Blautia schinkii]
MKPVVFDVFSGAGGFSLGFEMAGCEVVAAIEHDKWAADTFSFNHPKAKMMLGDIESFDEKYLRENVTPVPDIIIGGPPCQGFSICVKDAGDPKDPRNSLFIEFIRMAKIFNPKVMVMENVPNIAKAKTKSGERVVDIIKSEFEKLGYNVYRDILTASDYGVPQMRQRFILIASKQKLTNPFPKKTHYVAFNANECEQLSFFSAENNELKKCPTLWEAISDLPDIEAREGAEIMEYTKKPSNDYQKWCRKKTKVLHNHLAMKHTKRLVERFSRMTWGQSVSDITDERLKQRKRNGNGEVSDKPYDQNNRRMHPDKICHTITATFYGNFVHPYKNRNFTAREGARIQSFPDDYVFLGKPTVVSKKLLMKEGREGEAYLCQYSQIGNAVPPLMAKSIAENIIQQIDFEKE